MDAEFLMTALRFTPEDLAANRAGRLSEVQVYHLRVRRQRSILSGIGLILAAALIATLFLFAGRRGDNPILMFVGMGVTLCSAAFTGIFARHWLRLSADVQAQTVQVISGRLERVVRPVTRRVVNYAVRVETVEVVVSKDIFEVFQHKSDYTLYQARHSGLLLAAEPGLHPLSTSRQAE